MEKRIKIYEERFDNSAKDVIITAINSAMISHGIEFDGNISKYIIIYVDFKDLERVKALDEIASLISIDEDEVYEKEIQCEEIEIFENKLNVSSGIVFDESPLPLLVRNQIVYEVIYEYISQDEWMYIYVTKKDVSRIKDIVGAWRFRPKRLTDFIKQQLESYKENKRRVNTLVIILSISIFILFTKSGFIDPYIMLFILVFLLFLCIIFSKFIVDSYYRYPKEICEKFKHDLFQELLKMQPEEYILEKEGFSENEIEELKNNPLINTFEYDDIKSEYKLFIPNKDIIISELKLLKKENYGEEIFDGVYINLKLNNSIKDKIYIKNIELEYKEDANHKISCKNLKEFIEKTFDKYFIVSRSFENPDNNVDNDILTWNNKLKFLKLFMQRAYYDGTLMCIDEDRLTILFEYKILDDIHLDSSSSPESIYDSKIEDFENSMNLIRYIIANFEDFQL